MAAAVDSNRLYTIGRGTLRAFDIAQAGQPALLGAVGDLGNTRQLVVRDGAAYVTSREDGVFIVGVADPRSPKLLSHYDTLEVATGVAVSGDVLFVTCRHYGVELIDVRDPRTPKHLGIARTGEAQSVDVRNGYAYVGVWGSSELVVVDARNPRAPAVTARCELDGYGDGVFVKGERAYVATGHHSRERKGWRPGPGDPGYGEGHGMEIWSLADPARPTLISRTKTPPLYNLGNDMWSVRVAGDHAFLADTHNGVFALDVSDPTAPRFVGHCRLPLVAERGLPGFVGGIALAQDHLYVAGGWTDLHVVEASGLARPVVKEPDTPPAIPLPTPISSERFRLYRCEGQVREVAFVGDLAVVAAGCDGIHVLEVEPEPRLLRRYNTRSFAMSVAVHGELVFVAEERGGLSIWRHVNAGALEPMGRYAPKGRLVRAVTVPPPGRYALLQLDLSVLDIVDVSNPTAPVSVLTDKGHGFVYDLGAELADGRFACVLWQLHGLRWYDLYGGPKPTLSDRKYEHRLGNDGMAPFGNQRLVVFRGGYTLLTADEQRPPENLPIHRVPGCTLRGHPTLQGDTLIVAGRATGQVSLVDVSNIEEPRLIERLSLPGSPGPVTIRNGRLALANGHAGLWVERAPRQPTQGVGAASTNR